MLRPTLAALAVLQAASWVDPSSHHVQFARVDDGVQLEGNTAHVFDEFAPKLTNLGHIYAMTRRGYGASSRPEAGYDVSRLGEDVLAAIQTVPIDKQARAFERGVPGARVLRWPRASHDLFLTRQADVIKEVTAFIAALP
jgi:hypothetical protein